MVTIHAEPTNHAQTTSTRPMDSMISWWKISSDCIKGIEHLLHWQEQLHGWCHQVTHTEDKVQEIFFVVG